MELKHHGIMGMKWGVRRYQNPDGSLTPEGKKRYNENYSSEQRARDKRVYSSGAVKRINKRMNAGEGIQGARSAEADRLENTIRRTRLGANVASMVGAIGGAVGTAYVTNKVLTKHGVAGYTSAIVSTAAAAGGAAIGKNLGRMAGVTIGMLAGGYNTGKFR